MLLDEEVFKNVNIEGFEHYFISNKGRVSNGKKIMSHYYSSDGYPRICLTSKGKQKKFNVHRLVAYAFIGHPINEKMQVNHINYCRYDNRVENLEWVTAKENIMHSIKNGNIDIEKLKKQAKYANEMACKARRKKIELTFEDGTKYVFDSAVEMEKEMGLCRKALGSVARGETKQYKGYTAKYI